jgi:uncharacterized protein with HEPN domain
MIHDDIVYLQHILDSIKDIKSSVGNLSKEEFQESKDIRDACIRRLEVIGEAAKNLSQEIRDKYPLVEWKKIVGAMDLMIHSYFRVDLDVVWDILNKDLPVLKKQIVEIKKGLDK